MASSSSSLPSPPPSLVKIGSFHGQDVLQCQLHSPQSGMTVDIINYGALIRDWQVPLPDGSRRSVVLGFDQFQSYPEHSPFFGAIVGRVANRIGGAKFTLDGREYLLPANEGKNHLHGGPASFGKRLWQITPLSATAVQLELVSADGDGSYPGNLSAKVVYKLDNNRLTIEFEAETDKATPVNLVQHNYFNLAGHGDVRDHFLEICADSFTPTTPDLVPTGAISPVAGTELDFRVERTLEGADGHAVLSLDNNFVLNPARNCQNEPVVRLTAPDKSLRLRLWTDQPGLHVYTSGGLSLQVPGLHGQKYPRFGAICLEDQNFPDAVNHPQFPSPILRPVHLRNMQQQHSPSSPAHSSASFSPADRHFLRPLPASSCPIGRKEGNKKRTTAGKKTARNRGAGVKFGGKKPHQVARRNERERKRVQQVNNGYELLAGTLTKWEAATLGGAGGEEGGGGEKKLTKAETLKAAILYIRHLEQILQEKQQQQPNGGGGGVKRESSMGSAEAEGDWPRRQTPSSAAASIIIGQTPPSPASLAYCCPPPPLQGIITNSASPSPIAFLHPMDHHHQQFHHHQPASSFFQANFNFSSYI